MFNCTRRERGDASATRHGGTGGEEPTRTEGAALRGGARPTTSRPRRDQGRPLRALSGATAIRLVNGDSETQCRVEGH